jgi:anthranilate phosphoribosyltransferase
VRCQSFVYGLSHPAVVVSARLLHRLGISDVTVVNSSPMPGCQVDELIPGGAVRVCRLVAGRENPELRDAVAEAAGADGPFDLGSLAQRADPHANVAAVVRLLAGRAPAPARRTVALNAAVLMLTARSVPSLQAGMDTAHAILDDGAALDTLHRFVSLTGGTPHAVDALLGVPDDHRAAPAEPAPRGLPQNAPASGRLAVPLSEKEMTAC